jgi:hypothetical protein
VRKINLLQGIVTEGEATGKGRDSSGVEWLCCFAKNAQPFNSRTFLPYGVAVGVGVEGEIVMRVAVMVWLAAS